jgi:ribosomal protein S18 acetylase RimI-like enzyme
MLGVAPDARGRGIGRMIMDACEERASASGRTLITLNTTLLMRSAQRMYESMGYSRDEDRVFPDGFVLLSYSKRLV